MIFKNRYRQCHPERSEGWHCRVWSL